MTEDTQEIDWESGSEGETPDECKEDPSDVPTPPEADPGGEPPQEEKKAKKPTPERQQCQHVYKTGMNSGNRCHVWPKNGNPFCATHRPREKKKEPEANTPADAGDAKGEEAVVDDKRTITSKINMAKARAAKAKLIEKEKKANEELTSPPPLLRQKSMYDTHNETELRRMRKMMDALMMDRLTKKPKKDKKGAGRGEVSTDNEQNVQARIEEAPNVQKEVIKRQMVVLFD